MKKYFDNIAGEHYEFGRLVVDKIEGGDLRKEYRFKSPIRVGPMVGFVLIPSVNWVVWWRTA